MGYSIVRIGDECVTIEVTKVHVTELVITDKNGKKTTVRDENTIDLYIRNSVEVHGNLLDNFVQDTKAKEDDKVYGKRYNPNGTIEDIKGIVYDGVKFWSWVANDGTWLGIQRGKSTVVDCYSCVDDVRKKITTEDLTRLKLNGFNVNMKEVHDNFANEVLKIHSLKWNGDGFKPILKEVKKHMKGTKLVRIEGVTGAIDTMVGNNKSTVKYVDEDLSKNLKQVYVTWLNGSGDKWVGIRKGKNIEGFSTVVSTHRLISNHEINKLINSGSIFKDITLQELNAEIIKHGMEYSAGNGLLKIGHCLLEKSNFKGRKKGVTNKKENTIEYLKEIHRDIIRVEGNLQNTEKLTEKATNTEDNGKVSQGWLKGVYGLDNSDAVKFISYLYKKHKVTERVDVTDVMFEDWKKEGKRLY